MTKTSLSDGYVRIPTSALCGVELRHLLSNKDMSIAVLADARTEGTVTGYTEWVGSWHDLPVSVGWDWAVVQGIIVLLNPNEIRTNIQLLTSDCQPELPALARIHLLHWIESLPWREAAIEDLLANDGCSGEDPGQ